MKHEGSLFRDALKSSAEWWAPSTRWTNYRARLKGGLQVAWRLQARLGRSGKQQQSQNLPIPGTAFSPSPVYLAALRSQRWWQMQMQMRDRLCTAFFPDLFLGGRKVVVKKMSKELLTGWYIKRSSLNPLVFLACVRPPRFWRCWRTPRTPPPSAPRRMTARRGQERKMRTYAEAEPPSLVRRNLLFDYLPPPPRCVRT